MQNFHDILGKVAAQIKTKGPAANQRRFFKWIVVKKKLHDSGSIPKFHEGEIWWCALGENVGVEINGKSNAFSRPVVIFRKLSKQGFMGIPLSTQKHDGTWYVNFRFRGREEYAVLAQSRVMSASRLYRKMGEVGINEMSLIRRGFSRLYTQKYSPGGERG